MVLMEGLGGDILGVRQSSSPSSPCPDRDGTTYTSPETQDFTVFCGRSSSANTIMKWPAPSFPDCMNLCSTAHLPRCGGVSFINDTKTCVLYSTLDEDSLEAAAPGQGVVDSARALFPGAASDCRSLGSQVVVGVGGPGAATAFSTRCGRVIDGGEIQQEYAPTYTACLETCAGVPGCRAVSFEASQFAGFANCYLKSATGPPSARIFVNLAIDSAVLVSPPAVATASPSQSTVTVTAEPASVTVTMPPPGPASTSGPTAAGASPAVGADPLDEVLPLVSASSGAGRTVSFEVWVATLIVGFVAVLAATAALVLLMKRRRQRRQKVIEQRNVAAYWPSPPEEPGFEKFGQGDPKSKDAMGNITVVSTFGQSFEKDDRDPDGRREWWKRGASPRASVTDSA